MRLKGGAIRQSMLQLGSAADAVRAGVLLTERIRRWVDASFAGTTGPIAASAAAIAAVLVLVPLVTGSATPTAGASLAHLDIEFARRHLRSGLDGSGLRKLTPRIGSTLGPRSRPVVSGWRLQPSTGRE